MYPASQLENKFAIKSNANDHDDLNRLPAEWQEVIQQSKEK